MSSSADQLVVASLLAAGTPFTNTRIGGSAPARQRHAPAAHDSARLSASYGALAVALLQHPPPHAPGERLARAVAAHVDAGAQAAAARTAPAGRRRSAPARAGGSACRPAGRACAPACEISRPRRSSPASASVERVEAVLLRTFACSARTVTRVAAQPPIADIVRGGWRKPGSPTWCFSSLRQTASRTIGSSSASLAPARSGARRSVSWIENRQVRSLPSAVSRIRLQSAQNGSETGLMKPISPRAVGEAEHARGRVRLARQLLERVDAVDDRADLLAGQHLVASTTRGRRRAA